MAQSEHAPSDHTTLTEVLEGYEEAGIHIELRRARDGVVRCDTCGSELDPTRIHMRSLRRLEGASDPDDMLAVVVLQCGVCSASGTMVLGYGPASPTPMATC